MRNRLLNYILYQAGWLVMVLAAAKGHPWPGAGVGLFLVLVHVILARERKPEIVTILLVGVLGTLVDTIQAFFGVFVFESGYWTFWVIPFWITVMWLQFATLLHYLLTWLSGRYLLAIVLGAAGGPAVYLAGELLGAVIFPFGMGYSLKVLAVVWAVVLPTVVWIAHRNRPSTGIGKYRFVGTSDR
jgi:hypothetical protein